MAHYPYERRLLDNVAIDLKPLARASEAIGVSETFSFSITQGNRLLGGLAFVMGRVVRSPSPGAVHDLRVAVRRFQQALAVFAPYFPVKDTKKTGRKLKRIMALAGEVRDYDIAARLLSRSGNVPALQGKIDAQRKAACERLTALLQRMVDRNWYAKWRARLGEADASVQPQFGDCALESTAGRIVPRMAKEFFTLGNRATEVKASARKLHQFRLAAKRFRYTLELLEPVYGPGLRARLETIRAVQTLLGDVNDCRTARDLVAAWEGSQEFEARLRRRQRRKTKEFAAKWNGTLAGPTKARQWIRYLSRVDTRTHVTRKHAALAASKAAHSANAAMQVA